MQIRLLTTATKTTTPVTASTTIAIATTITGTTITTEVNIEFKSIQVVKMVWMKYLSNGIGH